MQQAGAVGIAATRWVDHRRGPRARDLELPILGVDARSFRSARDDERLDPQCQVPYRPTGLLLQQLPLVVVDRNPVGVLDETVEVRRLEHGQTLSGIEDEGNAQTGELF